MRSYFKKIDNQIKVTVYGGNKDVVEAQIKLWELRENIMKEINKFVDIYFVHHTE